MVLARAVLGRRPALLLVVAPINHVVLLLHGFLGNSPETGILRVKRRLDDLLPENMEREVVLLPFLLLHLPAGLLFLEEEGFHSGGHRLQGIVHPPDILDLHPVGAEHLERRPGPARRQGGGEAEVHGVEARTQTLDDLAEGLQDLLPHRSLLATLGIRWRHHGAEVVLLGVHCGRLPRAITRVLAADTLLIAAMVVEGGAGGRVGTTVRVGRELQDALQERKHIPGGELLRSRGQHRIAEEAGTPEQSRRR
mmetsp:Transcript_46270/g.98900  ORF Transcript_46270/g.98900 Transcript_46270/m.98900 type:complete len:252 (-) Transcript_46270:562-1317(-)